MLLLQSARKILFVVLLCCFGISVEGMREHATDGGARHLLAQHQRVLERVQTYSLAHVHSEHGRSTRKHKLHDFLVHPERTNLILMHEGQEIKVELDMNHKLLGPSYYEHHMYYDDFGVHHPDKSFIKTKDEIEHCYYQGHVLGEEGRSVATINACGGQGFSGTIRRADDAHDGERLIVKPAALYFSDSELDEHVVRLQDIHGDRHTVSRSTLHVVYKAQDYDHGSAAKCGVTEDEEEHAAHVHNINLHSFKAEDDEESAAATQRDLQGNTDFQYVELLVVNDRSRVDAFGGEPQTDSVDIAAEMNNIYKGSFDGNTNGEPKVTITLIGQVLFPKRNPWNITEVGNNEISHPDLLNDFHAWRTIPDVTTAHDNAQLFTQLDFEGATVGYAGVQTMCITSNSGGIDQTTGDLAFNAAVASHEMGHNFGFLHDSSGGNTCAASGNIMNAIISVSPTEFSQCSHAYFDNWPGLGRVCLDNEPTRQYVFGDPECGNGFRETGEDCDCGSLTSCTDVPNAQRDSCCEAETCKLKQGADCSAQSDCCTDECTLVAAGTLCRAGASECDFAEECDGKDEDCPTDQFLGPGTPCDDVDHGAGVCGGGSCMSLTLECATVGALYGGGYEPCAAVKTGDALCRQLECDNGAGCITFETTDGAGDVVKVETGDGVLCGVAKQCRNGRCESSQLLSPNYQWYATAWSKCSSCNEDRTRSVTCRYRSPEGRYVSAREEFCPAGKPLSADQCLVIADCTGDKCICVRYDADNQADLVSRGFAEKFGAVDKADALRDAVPRPCGPEDFDANDLDYQRCLAVLSALGVLGSFCALVWILTYACCEEKCEPACCYGCDHELTQREILERRKKIYLEKKKDPNFVPPPPPRFHEGRVGPILALGGTTLLLMIFCSLGYFYNGEVRRGLVAEDVGMAGRIEALLDEGELFVGSLALVMQDIIDGVDDVDTAAVDMSVYVNVFRLGARDCARALSAVNASMHNTTFTIRGSGTAPDVSTGGSDFQSGPLVDTRDNMTTGARSDTGQTRLDFDELADSAESSSGLLSDFTGGLGSDGGLQRSQDSLDGLSTYIVENRPLALDFVDYMKEMNDYRWSFSIVFFAVPFFNFLALIGEFLFKWNHMMRLSIWLGFFTLFGAWVMLIVHLPFAVVLGDVCYFMTAAETNASTLDMSQTSADALVACLANTSLADATRVTDGLRFSSFVEFPDPFPTIDELFVELDPLKRVYQQSIANLTYQDLYDSDAELASNLATINGFGTTYGQPSNWAENNVSNVNAGLYGADSATVSLEKDTALTMLRVRNRTAARVASLKREWISMLKLIKTTRADVATALTDYENDAATVNPVLSSITAFKRDAYCPAAVGDNYFIFKNSLCVVESTGWTWLSVAFFVVGCIQPFNLWIMIVSLKRVEHEQHIHTQHDTELFTHKEGMEGPRVKYNVIKGGRKRHDVQKAKAHRRPAKAPAKGKPAHGKAAAHAGDSKHSTHHQHSQSAKHPAPAKQSKPRRDSTENVQVIEMGQINISYVDDDE